MACVDSSSAAAVAAVAAGAAVAAVAAVAAAEAAAAVHCRCGELKTHGAPVALATGADEARSLLRRRGHGAFGI